MPFGRVPPEALGRICQHLAWLPPVKPYPLFLLSISVDSVHVQSKPEKRTSPSHSRAWPLFKFKKVFILYRGLYCLSPFERAPLSPVSVAWLRTIIREWSLILVAQHVPYHASDPFFDEGSRRCVVPPLFLWKSTKTPYLGQDDDSSLFLHRMSQFS